MAEQHTCCTRTVFNAKVLSNAPVRRRYYRLTLELDKTGSQCFANARPGQFAEFDLSRVSLPCRHEIPENLADIAGRQIILRRPFSFSDVRLTGDSPPTVSIEVLYCVLGPATLRMTTLKAGDSLSLIGPLGNGFSVPDGSKVAVLIAGGMGSPPLQHLAAYLRANHPDMQVVAFAGAKSLDDFPFTVKCTEDGDCVPVEFARLGDEAHVATDDGSAGYHGYVTACAEKWLAGLSCEPDRAIIYSCGPEMMLSEVAKLAANRRIDCQVSMERMMACGIGLCQSCAVEVRSDNGAETSYRLCCKDGPVFDSKDVCFHK